MSDVPTGIPKRPAIYDLVDRLNALPSPSDVEEREVEDLPERENL